MYISLVSVIGIISRPAQKAIASRNESGGCGYNDRINGCHRIRWHAGLGVSAGLCGSGVSAGLSIGIVGGQSERQCCWFGAGGWCRVGYLCWDEWERRDGCWSCSCQVGRSCSDGDTQEYTRYGRFPQSSSTSVPVASYGVFYDNERNTRFGANPHHNQELIRPLKRGKSCNTAT